MCLFISKTRSQVSAEIPAVYFLILVQSTSVNLSEPQEIKTDVNSGGFKINLSLDLGSVFASLLRDEVTLDILILKLNIKTFPLP